MWTRPLSAKSRHRDERQDLNTPPDSCAIVLSDGSPQSLASLRNSQPLVDAVIFQRAECRLWSDLCSSSFVSTWSPVS